MSLIKFHRRCSTVAGILLAASTQVLIAQAQSWPVKPIRAIVPFSIGSSSHWAVERILLSGGFSATHVPFKGGPEGILEVSTGRVDFMSPGVSSALPFLRDGRLIALAVSTAKRSTALPDVPTTQEAGFANADYTFWNGLLVPAGTPRAVVDRLHREVQKVLAQPGVKEKFVHLGVEPMPLSPAEFDALISREIDINLSIVKAAKLKFD